MPRPLARRWVGLALALVAVVSVCALAAVWQWNRYEDRVAGNAALDEAVAAGSVPVAELLAPGEPVAEELEFRQVDVEGTYDAANAVVLRLRPLDGRPGSHQLVPLVTDDGATLLVDRGWFADRGTSGVAPEPPEGRVEATVRLRLSESTDGPGGSLADGTIRSVDVAALGEALGRPTYGAWGELVAEQPTAPGLTLVPPPERGTGPHLPYAAQWVAFAVLAVGGFVLLARQERRESAASRGTRDDETSGDRVE